MAQIQQELEQAQAGRAEAEEALAECEKQLKAMRAELSKCLHDMKEAEDDLQAN